MKRFVTIALIVAGFAFPAFSQHGGGHGGFAGRGAGSAFRSGGSGFRAGSSGFHGRIAPPSFSRRPVSPGFAVGSRDWGRGRGGPPRRDRFRRPYAPFWGAAIPYGYLPWSGWLDDGLPGDFGYDDESQDQEPQLPASPYEPYGMPPGTSDYGAPYAYGPPGAQGAYGPPGPAGSEAPPPDRTAPRSPYRPSPQAPGSSAAPLPQQTLTLIFKDGRPRQQVHNYILTPKWLYIQDENHSAVPVNELDLAATARVNRQAGVDFQLPAVSP